MTIWHFLFAFLLMAALGGLAMKIHQPLIWDLLMRELHKFIPLIIVHNNEKIVVERLGKFRKVYGSGLKFLIPILDKTQYVNWRESGSDPLTGQYSIRDYRTNRILTAEIPFDINPQNVITRDNASLRIDGFIMFQVHDAFQFAYEIVNFPVAFEKLTESCLRNIIGSMKLRETLTSRPIISKELNSYLRAQTFSWGVTIKNVEIQNIAPEERVLEAMTRQYTAKQEKFATYHRAQGEARMLEEVTRIVQNRESASRYLATLRYVEAFKELVSKKDGKVVFIPYESNNLMSSLGFLKEFFEEGSNKSRPKLNIDLQDE